MAGNENQKKKLLCLMEILSENTDENHPLTINDIISHLSKMGISAERKSLYKDMKLLDPFDSKIKYNNKVGYYIDKRDFELSELKLLVDAVQSSKFITKEKSRELIEKIKKLTSKHLGSELERQVVTIDRVKTMNEDIYINVDKLHNAINENKEVQFKYFEYTVEKEKKARNNGQPYTVSPYALSWTNDNYYLVAYHSKYPNQLTHFRVDRMEDIEIGTERRKNLEELNGEKAFNIGEYSKQIFCMFSGKSEKVELKFHNSLINAVIDRFGKDISVRKKGDEYFTVRVDVAVSNAFMTWIFQFGEKAQILYPEYLAEDMKERAKKIFNLYAKSQ